ncbi:TadE/TadG family type IV pilus assembly protein [Novosphingobium album (ex Hu et al. 2023)]|uniref:Pilus assembly protein n=1 Tax=Novosphingobium album (ex Hu et al. 2023) TaxID=2930093 RepID=A0ABT0B0P6_9SPHN|nr:TadE/TadG family type IV pilus assembly protein [Novosphingobium album (ex Hu et al. 2023)]MCJ2178501.1 pilus assembly protein [Novosphingobium album (ex Hu et al. 2023)]
MSQIVQAALADGKGAAVIELAIVLPVLLFLVAGIIDVSRYICAKIDVEQAAQRTTAFALAKRPTGSSAAYLVPEAVAAAGVPSNNVTAQLFLECDGVRQSKYATPCNVGQSTARFVSVSIKRQVQLLFNWTALGRMLSAPAMASTITVTGSSLMRIQ